MKPKPDKEKHEEEVEENPFIINDLTEEDLRPTPEEARLLDMLSDWEKASKISLDNKEIGSAVVV